LQLQKDEAKPILNPSYIYRKMVQEIIYPIQDQEIKELPAIQLKVIAIKRLPLNRSRLIFKRNPKKSIQLDSQKGKRSDM
jgi:hypothetical protein